MAGCQHIVCSLAENRKNIIVTENIICQSYEEKIEFTEFIQRDEMQIFEKRIPTNSNPQRNKKEHFNHLLFTFLQFAWHIYIVFISSSFIVLTLNCLVVISR